MRNDLLRSTLLRNNGVKINRSDVWNGLIIGRFKKSFRFRVTPCQLCVTFCITKVILQDTSIEY